MIEYAWPRKEVKRGCLDRPQGYRFFSMPRRKIRGRDRAVAERRARSGGKTAARGHAANRPGRRSQGRQGRSQQLSSRSTATKRVVVPIQREEHWTDGLMLDNRGVPLGNLRNVLHAFRHAPEWRVVLAFDEFAARVITTKPPPWGGPPGERWVDDHDTRACAWMQEQHIRAGRGDVGHAIQTVARENRVHPVREYLNALRWDGTPRIDTWLIVYLGVEDTPYVRAIGPRFLVSGTARVFEPGCQADTMPIFEGSQGILKSSALRALAAPWFIDRISNLGSKDSSMEVAGVWLIEWAELDALFKVGNSASKSFITRRHERFRPPYGKHLVDCPRQCIFAGTTNLTGGYLTDPTGARRFWPIRCGVIDLEALRRDRDQLWAEALVRYRAGARWHLETAELEALATAEQKLRFEVDAWEERVSDWLVGRNDVSVGEVLVGALGIPQENWSQPAQTRIAKILVHNGFEQYRPGKKGQPRTPRYRRDVVGDQHDLRTTKFTKKSA
jgi:predicted P-loop ATPase